MRCFEHSSLAFQLGTTGGGSGYTLAAGPNTGSGLSQAIYYVPNIVDGTNTVTVTFNQPAAYVDIRVLEYSGVTTTSPFDVAAFGSGTINSGATVSTANATTTAANEMIVGAGITSWTFDAAGSGFTLDTITSDGSIAEHEAVTTAGSYNASAHAYGPTGTNWLMQMASFKAATTTGTSVYADVAYAPYGETYAPSGAPDVSFTGQNNDTVGNLYDFLFREYHPVQGRWISPDPAGMAAADPMNPESWNRYAYVGNSPLTALDANGLVTLPGCEEGEFGCGVGVDPGCGMWGGPAGDICTLLLPAIPIWGGGGGGSGSGGSGGGGTANGGSTGSGGGTTSSVGSGGRIANFPNGENLGLPPGVSGNWGGILGAILPVDPSCEFGPCLPIGNNFEGGEVAAAGVCVFVEPCGTIAVAVGIGVAAVEAGAIIYLARKADIRQFDHAVRQIEKICGKQLSPEEKRRLHDMIHGQDFGFRDIVQTGVGMFCPDRQ